MGGQGIAKDDRLPAAGFLVINEAIRIPDYVELIGISQFDYVLSLGRCRVPDETVDGSDPLSYVLAAGEQQGARAIRKVNGNA